MTLSVKVFINEKFITTYSLRSHGVYIFLESKLENIADR